jgi:hypothetical protein
MRLTFIISIDPVKELSLLNLLLHSLNLQTRKNFDVIFYNQTRLSESEVFARLQVRPEFAYRFFSVERFLGNFPLWDLYSFHRQLLESDLLGDYFMSMHIEEFFDVDYVENVTSVLETTGFDILLGNLCRTPFHGVEIMDIVQTAGARAFADYLCARKLKQAPHWSLPQRTASLIGKLRFLKRHSCQLVDFGFRTRLTPNRKGYSRLSGHYEDLYFMRREFAHRYDWFLSGRRMYFEDIQLCDIPGVCELGRELARLTDFPTYFNLSKIYHVKHARFYYQLEDPAFTEALLDLETDEPLLQTLQRAVAMYRAGTVTLAQALRYTRENSAGTGTQNLNYKYHMEVIEKARVAKDGTDMRPVATALPAGAIVSKSPVSSNGPTTHRNAAQQS